MTPQLSLTYSPAYVGSEVWKQRIEVLRRVVNHLGLKEVAFTLDVSGSMLSDSLNERDRKRWAGEWLDIVKQMLLHRMHGDEIALDLYRRLAELDVAGSPFAIRDEEAISAEELAAYERVRAIKERKGRAR